MHIQNAVKIRRRLVAACFASLVLAAGCESTIAEAGSEHGVAGDASGAPPSGFSIQIVSIQPLQSSPTRCVFQFQYIVDGIKGKPTTLFGVFVRDATGSGFLGSVSKAQNGLVISDLNSAFRRNNDGSQLEFELFVTDPNEKEVAVSDPKTVTSTC